MSKVLRFRTDRLPVETQAQLLRGTLEKLLSRFHAPVDEEGLNRCRLALEELEGVNEDTEITEAFGEHWGDVYARCRENLLAAIEFGEKVQ